MSARPWRRRALFGALAVTVILSGASGKSWQSEESEPLLPLQKRTPYVANETAPSLQHVELERLQRQEAPAKIDTAASHAFSAMSWYVPPPPPPPQKPLPPPPPTAPPMPFTFMGRYEEGGARIILLVRGERIYTVSEGDVIDNTYRVERLTAGQLELTYLPLNIKQTISTGGA